ncbi:MAG: DUF3333 domain-containing protein, partial [Emcibacteraceae bacterium]|nr:DUF3333 domain-containing protein [Emcibacteraceae bacterium]
MTDIKNTSRVDWSSPEQAKRLKRRYLKEKIFKSSAVLSLCMAISALMVVMVSIFTTGISGFTETRIKLDVQMDSSIIGDVSSMDQESLEKHIASMNANRLLIASLQKKFPDITTRRDVFSLLRLFSVGAQSDIRTAILKDTKIIDQ